MSYAQFFVRFCLFYQSSGDNSQ